MSSTWEPIRDWPAFLHGSAFWVWYYANHIYVDEVDVGEDPIETLRELFGEEEPDDLHRLLGPGLARGDGTLGSALDLPMPGGFTWRLQFMGWPAVHHHLDHPDFPEPVCLGWDDPHPKLPELPWHETRSLVVDTFEGPQPAQVPAYFVLPLLIPMVTWEPAEEDEVRSLLWDAWTGSGMLTPHRVQEVADRLTRFPDDAPAAPGEAAPTAVTPLKELFGAIRTHCR